jgi:hypothetical protein
MSIDSQELVLSTKKKKQQPLGFGFDKEKTEHCFLVTIPISKAKDAKVLVSEHFHWIKPDAGVETTPEFNDIDAQLKAILNRQTWEQIEDHVKAEFNRRLRQLGLKTGKWLKKGQIPVDRTFGKELTVLAWALEDSDPELAIVAVHNWLGLVPEERWWLYTMTNAATGHAINGRNRGWRKAVRFALTENPIVEGAIKNRRAEFELSPMPDRT